MEFGAIPVSLCQPAGRGGGEMKRGSLQARFCCFYNFLFRFNDDRVSSCFDIVLVFKKLPLIALDTFIDVKRRQHALGADGKNLFILQNKYQLQGNTAAAIFSGYDLDIS